MALNRYQRGQDSGFAKPQEEETSADLDALKARLEKVKQRKIKTELLLEQTNEAIAECQSRAQKEFGVSSLEELEKLVVKMEEEDRRAMEQFMARLEEEEQKIQRLDERMQQMDRDTP